MTKRDTENTQGNQSGYPKLQKRFASYDPDIFQTQEDVDRLMRMVAEEEAELAKEKESQN